MADVNVKKEIQFAESMTSDKRNADFAYFRKNVLPSKTAGLYPSYDFIQTGQDAFTAGWQILDILGNGSVNGGWYPDMKVIVKDTNNRTRFYNLGFYNGESNDPLPVGVYVAASAYGNGSNGGVYVAASDSKVYSVNFGVSTTSVVATGLPNNSSTVGGYDGLDYYWAGSQGIIRQNGATVTTVFGHLGFTPLNMVFFNDMVVFSYQTGNDIGVVFWDKNDAVLFNKRIIIKNSVYLAMGVVDGLLMLVRSVGNSANVKEYIGEVVISGFNGENFKTLNSIRAGRAGINAPFTSGTLKNSDVGSEVLVFSVTGNYTGGNYADYNTILGRNYIYKVKKNGAIEIQELPLPAGDAIYVPAYASIVKVAYDSTVYATDSNYLNPIKIYSNREPFDEFPFTNYSNFTTTEYITNFLTNPYNFHKLDALSVSFEKMFKNSDGTGGAEQVDIYYRTSDRVAFTLLGTVTAQKIIDNVDARMDQTGIIPIPKQRYQFTKMPDGSSLPQFNEIQFQFKLSNGASLIGAWFEYHYLERTTLR